MLNSAVFHIVFSLISQDFRNFRISSKSIEEKRQIESLFEKELPDRHDYANTTEKITHTRHICGLKVLCLRKYEALEVQILPNLLIFHKHLYSIPKNH